MADPTREIKTDKYGNAAGTEYGPWQSFNIKQPDGSSKTVEGRVYVAPSYPGVSATIGGYQIQAADSNGVADNNDYAPSHVGGGLNNNQFTALNGTAAPLITQMNQTNSNSSGGGSNTTTITTGSGSSGSSAAAPTRGEHAALPQDFSNWTGWSNVNGSAQRTGTDAAGNKEVQTLTPTFKGGSVSATVTYADGTTGSNQWSTDPTIRDNAEKQAGIGLPTHASAGPPATGNPLTGVVDVKADHQSVVADAANHKASDIVTTTPGFAYDGGTYTRREYLDGSITLTPASGGYDKEIGFGTGTVDNKTVEADVAAAKLTAAGATTTGATTPANTGSSSGQGNGQSTPVNTKFETSTETAYLHKLGVSADDAKTLEIGGTLQTGGRTTEALNANGKLMSTTLDLAGDKQDVSQIKAATVSQSAVPGLNTAMNDISLEAHKLATSKPETVDKKPEYGNVAGIGQELANGASSFFNNTPAKKETVKELSFTSTGSVDPVSGQSFEHGVGGLSTEPVKVTSSGGGKPIVKDFPIVASSTPLVGESKANLANERLITPSDPVKPATSSSNFDPTSLVRRGATPIVDDVPKPSGMSFGGPPTTSAPDTPQPITPSEISSFRDQTDSIAAPGGSSPAPDNTPVVDYAGQAARNSDDANDGGGYSNPAPTPEQPKVTVAPLQDDLSRYVSNNITLPAVTAHTGPTAGITGLNVSSHAGQTARNSF